MRYNAIDSEHLYSISPSIIITIPFLFQNGFCTKLHNPATQKCRQIKNQAIGL